MTGLEFRGGRPPHDDRERFAMGYRDARGDAAGGRAPVWRALGVPDHEHARIVPVYHAGYVAGRHDASAGVDDVEDAWWRFLIRETLKVTR